MNKRNLSLCALSILLPFLAMAQERGRARDFGIEPGILQPGKWNAITDVEGSCMIVIATDAPLSARNLERLAKRSFLALGRVGSFMSNGSGDYAIAFSTYKDCRIPYRSGQPLKFSPKIWQ